MGEIICGLLVVIGNVDACFISDDLELFLYLTICGLFAIFLGFLVLVLGLFPFFFLLIFVCL